MNRNEHIRYWLKSAEHDLKTAKSLLKTKKYDWCLFIGHLVLEKILKSIWIKDNKNQFPPKTHNLLKLAEDTNLKLDDSTKLQLLNINDFNIEIRYPDYKLEFYRKCNKSFAENNFNVILGLYKWLKKQI